MRSIMLRRVTFAVLLGVGGIIGWNHLLIAGRALLSSPGGISRAWEVGVWSGPALTLPAVVLALFSRKLAGCLLVLGALISTTAAGFVPREDTATFVRGMIYLVREVSGPMLILGGALWWLGLQGPLFRRANTRVSDGHDGSKM